jgi:hypothetical protein
VRHLLRDHPKDPYILLVKDMMETIVRWTDSGPHAKDLPADMDPKDLHALYMDPRCIGLFRRHWSPPFPELTDDPAGREGICYEGYVGGEDAWYTLFAGGNPESETVCRLFEAAVTKVLIVDERLDASTNAILSGEARHSFPPGRQYSVKDRFRWKGVVIKGEEYAGQSIPEHDLLGEWVADKNYDFICIHRGIMDKLERIRNRPFAELCTYLQRHVKHVIVHSGRLTASDMPEGVKFLPLSNVVAWIDRNYSKVQIVEELSLTRRV